MLVRNDNYYVVQGWMVNELGLKGNDLLIYAIIYGFSQTEEQRFTGSRKYLAEWTGSTKRTVQNSLNSLIDRGLIIKHENMVNGVKFCEYSISQVVKKVHWGGENFSLGGGEKISPNNIDIDNIDNNIDLSIKKNTKKKESFDTIISEYTSDDDLQDALSGFVEMRQKEKGFTIRALKLNLSKLDEIALDDYTKISVVNQSIEHGWKSFYPLKTNNNRKGDELPF